jgi:hypothetical protein
MIFIKKHCANSLYKNPEKNRDLLHIQRVGGFKHHTKCRRLLVSVKFYFKKDMVVQFIMNKYLAIVDADGRNEVMIILGIIFKG